MSETYIRTNILNDPEILKLIFDTVPYLPGWTIDTSITQNMSGGRGTYWKKYRNHVGKFISFDLLNKSVGWEAEDHDKEEEKEAVKIRSIAEMSKLLDGIYEWTVRHDKRKDEHS